jgi:succinate-semialdehyde dehydrogenase/glutarate-semialdehyde dehydrogenase
MKRSDAEALYPQLGQYINGDLIVGGGEFFGVQDPSTLSELGRYVPASEENVDAALTSANSGFDVWSRISAHERGKILKRVADNVRVEKGRLAGLITLESGRPLSEAQIEIDHSAAMFDWAAEEGKRAYGRIIPAREQHCTQYVMREPLGPVAAFTPWNVPLTTPARKLSGTLGAGCSVILKASEETPGSAIALAMLAVKAGVPSEAVSVLIGNPEMVSTRLLGSDIIRGLTFTGSTRVGKILIRQAADHLIRPVMELGGHAPVLIFGDVDVEKIAQHAVTAKFKNSGQICVSPTRFLVQREIYEAFLEKFVVATKRITVGDGFDPDVTMGPLRNAGRIREIEGLLTDATNRGHRVFGGERIGGTPGNFINPAVIADADSGTLASNIEPFGPVAVLQPFDSLGDAVREANRLNIGLASYVMTNHLGIANYCTAEIHAGSVIVNNWRATLPETPFGGYRESGFGSEGGIEGLSAFQNIKLVYLGTNTQQGSV